MSETNTELARRGYEAALQGDFTAIRELLAPQVRWHAGDPAMLSANVSTFRNGKVVEMVHYPTAEDALAAAA